MTSTDEGYWGSEDGRKAHRRLLLQRFDDFRSRATAKKTFKGSSFDVIALTDFPNPDMTFHCTQGMSDSILKKKDGTGIRQEISWTTRGREPLDYIENIVLNLGMITLDEEIAIPAGIILPQYPLATHLPAGTTVSTMLTRVGLWLDESEFCIEEYYPAFIIELVGLTDPEVDLFRKDEDRFYELFASGQVDFMDLKR